MKRISIILPDRIPILRDTANQGICWNKEEYSIYYSNIIYPYSDEYDIQIECRYGKNLGNCWRIDDFVDIEKEFDLAIKVYSYYGKLEVLKKCKIEIVEKISCKSADLLCIGDSMTMGETYISQAADKMIGVNTVGLRSIGHRVRHEGRGGWTCKAYFERYDDNGWGVSPFLFPMGYAGEKYFGDKNFWDKITDSALNTDYSYTGITRQSIRDDMVCFDNGMICSYSDGLYRAESGDPEFEFSFKKYVDRYLDRAPDIVSILFGANEFQLCGYDNFEKELDQYINAIKRMIRSIKECAVDISIIICMPVCGGGQYAWGMKMGCQGSSRQYDFCIKMACEAILKEFDNRTEENLYICPMLAVCDPDAGFPHDAVRANIYSEIMYTVNDDWVHPSESGYRQMGDALAAVIASILNRR